jgi:hypothetical protein
VTWLLPEFDTGEEPELKPPELELLELPEFDVLEFELELELELEFDVLEFDEVDAVLWADPGSTRASAPAVTTLATVTVVVADRTLPWPRSLAATAWRILSRCVLLMDLILRSGLRSRMHGTSRLPLNSEAPGQPALAGEASPAT